MGVAAEDAEGPVGGLVADGMGAEKEEGADSAEGMEAAKGSVTEVVATEAVRAEGTEEGMAAAAAAAVVGAQNCCERLACWWC
mmetsp:Transcript_25405/g.80198  ORF Transcript_25405/g.80198 Transcript_25405/m.80198 type:complete len:83 (-) Transcript_25405:212-460(-)